MYFLSSYTSTEASKEDICELLKQEKKNVVGQAAILKAKVTQYPIMPRIGAFQGHAASVLKPEYPGQIEMVGHPDKASTLFCLEVAHVTCFHIPLAKKGLWDQICH